MISLGMLLLLSTFVVNTTAAPTKVNAVTEVNVALLSPQSGELSAYTKGFEQAALLAVETLNDDASLNATWHFNLATYDTKTTPTGASEAMTAAVTTGAADYVVGAAGSSNTQSAAAIAVANKVPLISYASTSPAISEYDDHAVAGDEGYLWRTPPSDALQGQVIADLAHAAGYEEMVIVTLDNSYGEGLANSTNNEFTALGGEVLATITYAAATVDFGTIVTQIAAEEPDIVVAISYATDGSLLFVEMADQNLGVQVIGADGVADEGIFGETSGTAEAMAGYLLTKPSSVTSAEGAAFVAAYDARFSNTTGDIYTGETYDAVFAGALAINASGSTAGEDIIEALAALSWNGATGPLSFDENGDSSAGYYLISEVRGTEIEAVASWNPIDGLEFSDTEFLLDWRYRNADTTFDEGTDTTPTSSSSKKDDSPLSITPLIFGIVLMSFVTLFRRRN